MGRYKTTIRKSPRGPREPGPIWRGIGCLLIVIVPVLSYAAAVVTMPFFLERGLIPRDLLFTPQIPSWLWYAPVLAQIIQFLFVRYAIYAALLLTFLYILVISGFFSLLYAVMYRIAGPSRFGPLDAPPPKIKVKKYKR